MRRRDFGSFSLVAPLLTTLASSRLSVRFHSTSASSSRNSLTHDQVVFFREKGYIVLENFFTPQVLQQYGDVVKRATERRGPKLVFPNPDGNAYDLEVNIQGQQQLPASSSARNSNNTNNNQVQNSSSSSSQQQQQQQQVQKQHIQIQASSKKKCIRMAQNLRKKLKDTQQREGGVRVFDDENKMTTEELQEAHDEYIRSDRFQKEVVRKMRIQELMKFFEQIHKPWIHLWHGDDELSHFLLNEKFKNCTTTTTISSTTTTTTTTTVGHEIGKVACEASGCARVRLFSDRAAYRCAWGNASALQCTQPFVDFNDYRGTCATVLFPPITLGKDNGGYLVLEGSHHVMRKLTMNMADASVYKACPTAWDFGDCARRHPDDFRHCPAKHLQLAPGSLLLYSNQLVFGQVPNYSTEESFSHSIYLMPDGSVYNGLKHTWLSHDREGPLNEYRSGDPLNDDALFPMLYSAIDDLF